MNYKGTKAQWMQKRAEMERKYLSDQVVMDDAEIIEASSHIKNELLAWAEGKEYYNVKECPDLPIEKAHREVSAKLRDSGFEGSEYIERWGVMMKAILWK